MRKFVKIAYHAHCFDGVASAALLTRFLREGERDISGEEIYVVYRGLDHRPGGSHVPMEVLSGDVNCVVDFRYTTSERLTWWFDHHHGAFASEEERTHFAADTTGRKFFDPTYSSCCKLIADIARVRFGWVAEDLAPLVHWADVIDSAAFPSAEAAVDLDAPAMQLSTLIELQGDDALLAPWITRLAAGEPLERVAADDGVQQVLAPLREKHHELCEAARQRAELENGVVFVDLADLGSDRCNEFIPYWLFPDSRYAVAVTAGRGRTKVSVGSNPWAPVPRTQDLAHLCARYGGGGLPRAAAISFKPSQLEDARRIARAIVRALAGDAPPDDSPIHHRAPD